jgi:hypothetical protein
VPALNAQTVVLLGVAGAPCRGAGCRRRAGWGWAAAQLLVAGVASVVMAGLTGRRLHLHDGGILANAVSLSLVPAAVAGVLALGLRRSTGGRGVARRRRNRLVPPERGVSIAVTTVAWWAGMLVARRGRAELHRPRRSPSPPGHGGVARPRGGARPRPVARR